MQIQVTASDQSLFHVAARYYGDALQWWRIAQANDLTDPDLSGFETPVTLILSSIGEPGSYGGIPPE